MMYSPDGLNPWVIRGALALLCGQRLCDVSISSCAVEAVPGREQLDPPNLPPLEKKTLTTLPLLAQSNSTI